MSKLLERIHAAYAAFRNPALIEVQFICRGLDDSLLADKNCSTARLPITDHKYCAGDKIQMHLPSETITCTITGLYLEVIKI